MSRPRLALLLLFVVAASAMVDPAVAVAERSTRGHHHPPLLHCGPAPVLSKNADAAFRANLASALAALPSAAAAKRDAFSTVQIGRAFARGACFGPNVSSSPAATRACEACLSASARDVLGGCHSSGRAGAWRNECFLSYADSNASTAVEDAFRGWFYFYIGPMTKARLAAGACVTDRAVDCDQCWHDSAQVAVALGWWQRIHHEEVIVVGYSCFLRVRISTLPWAPDAVESFGSFLLILWLDVVFELSALILGALFFWIIKIVRALPQVG